MVNPRFTFVTNQVFFIIVKIVRFKVRIPVGLKIQPNFNMENLEREAEESALVGAAGGICFVNVYSKK